jgi:hypothetical protein
MCGWFHPGEHHDNHGENWNTRPLEDLGQARWSSFCESGGTRSARIDTWMSSYVLRTSGCLESLARIYKVRIESVGDVVSESHTTYRLEGEIGTHAFCTPTWP